jgi:RNA polymerase sigma factor (sigma-70 family)
MDFEQLSTQYSNMIHSIIHSLHIYKDHDDFYQIGLIALWNASENFDVEKGKFSTYAYSFIKGRILTHLRKEKCQEERYFPAPEENCKQLGYDVHFLEKENLLSYFYLLTDKEKQWVILRFFDGLSNRAIAEIWNVKVSTVRACERRTMGKLVYSV